MYSGMAAATRGYVNFLGTTAGSYLIEDGEGLNVLCTC